MVKRYVLGMRRGSAVMLENICGGFVEYSDYDKLEQDCARIASENACKQVEIHKLEKALQRYGWHENGCSGGLSFSYLCTCGYKALIDGEKHE